MNQESIHGACLCGAVCYEGDAPFSAFQYCHRSRCRRFAGSAHAANLCCPLAQFCWPKGEASVGRFEGTDQVGGLLEERLHSTEGRRILSNLSLANTRAARMSSCSRSGKS